MQYSKCHLCAKVIKGLCPGCKKAACGKHGKGEFCTECVGEYAYGMIHCACCGRYVKEKAFRGVGDEFFYCGGSSCFRGMY
jgi:hypothetical protein